MITTSLRARENSTELYKKGAALALSGDINAAIEIFRRVVAISPEYTLGHYGLGKALLYTDGGVEDAVLHLRKAVTLDRRFAKGYFYLGMGLMLSRRYVLALHAFEKAYRYDTSIIEALYNSAVIYDLLQKRRRAQWYYDEYLYMKKKGRMDILF